MVLAVGFGRLKYGYFNMIIERLIHLVQYTVRKTFYFKKFKLLFSIHKSHYLTKEI